MLVLPQESVKVRWHTKNKEWYESKGHIFTKFNDFFSVNILDLVNSSQVKISLICDYCQNPYKKGYSDYIRWRNKSPIKKDACINCIGEKIKESNQLVYGVNSTMQVAHHNDNYKDSLFEKYGVENISQVDKVKEKKKSTYLKNYGVPHYSQTDEYKQKYKDTSLERYGTEHPLQNSEIFTKVKTTNLERYGVEFNSQTDDWKDNYKETCLKRYGVECYSQSEEFLVKFKQTNIERYGVEFYTQTDEYKIKAKETNNRKFGKDSYAQTDEFKERFRQSSMKKYGVPNPNQNPEIKAKAMMTLYKNGNVPTSSQQLKIYEMLKDSGYKVELNYPLSNASLDVAIFIGDLKIDLEYDGSYWHQDEQKDRRRDEFVKSKGWKVLRVKSRNKVPDFVDIVTSLEKLIETDKSFTTLILDDYALTFN